MARKLLAVLSLSALVLSGCSSIPTNNNLESPTVNTELNIQESVQDSIEDSERTATSSKKVKPGPALNGPKAITVLNSLKVKNNVSGSNYNRSKNFGSGWKDFNKNSCDERQDTLKRDMSKVKYKDKKKCTVSSGTLHDSYTGKKINWKRGANTVDIDHVVALKNTWISGAQNLSAAQRQSLANDPLNLMASQASANRQKGDKSADKWLPGNKNFRCQYVATQVSVKKKYVLSVTSAEKKAMTKVLNSCKNQKAAKVTPVKPAGKSTAPKKETSKVNKGTVSGTVHPGSYCKASDSGKKGKSKAGKTYVCKKDSNGKLRWRV